MKRMNCCCKLILPGLLLSFNTVIAQTGSVTPQNSYENVINWYEKEVAENSFLYTGKEYPAYRSGIQGTPFFLSAQAQNGELFYNGTLYLNVPLFYDLVRQDVVINRYDDNTRIRLLNEKISYFVLEGHRFENITVDETNTEEALSGFYDVMFAGKASLLVNRIKRIEMTLDPAVPPKFTERDKFFIRNGGKFFAVNKTSSVIEALSDRKDKVKTFIRRNKFRFKKNPEEELISAIAYYETLIKE